jgi:hypothetical protein
MLGETDVQSGLHSKLLVVDKTARAGETSFAQLLSGRGLDVVKY